MFAVVNLHRLRVDVRFERIECIRQGRQSVRTRRRGSRLCVRRGERGTANERTRGDESSGLESFASCHHNRSFVKPVVKMVGTIEVFNVKLGIAIKLSIWSRSCRNLTNRGKPSPGSERRRT